MRSNGVRLFRLVPAIVLAAIAGHARAAGFQVNEHGTAAMGRAQAVTATIDDPSAIYHNPAGLTSVEGTQVYFGVTAISPHGAYEGPGLASTNPTRAVVREEASSQFIPVPNAYISRSLSPKAFIGFGFYLPYGLRLEWENPNFVGRTLVEQIELRTFFLTPTIALKLSDSISVAASVSLVPATVYLKRTLGAEDNGQVLFPTPPYSKEGKAELSGSAFGVGANAGIQITLIEHLRIGILFRSAVDLAFSGDVDFQLPSEVPAEIAANFPDGPVDAGVTLPHSFNIGVGWKDGPLTLEVGTQITLWDSYEELRINFNRGLPRGSTASPRNWTTSPLFKAGGEYRLGAAALRLGLGYDVSPAPNNTVDPTLPDADRFYFTAGAGYSFGPVYVDVAYMGLITSGREVKEGESLTFAPGKYTTGLTNLLALSLGVEL